MEQTKAPTDLVQQTNQQLSQKATTNANAAASAAVQESDSIRVKVPLLNRLMALAGEMVIVRNQQLQMADSLGSLQFNTTVQKLDVVTSEIQECVMQTRMQPVGGLFGKFTRVVRDLATQTNKKLYWRLFLTL